MHQLQQRTVFKLYNANLVNLDAMPVLMVYPVILVLLGLHTIFKAVNVK